MLRSLVVSAVVFAAHIYALTATGGAVNAADATFEVARLNKTGGLQGWLIKSLNNTEGLRAGAMLQVVQEQSANHQLGASVRWTISTSNNSKNQDGFLNDRVQVATKTISQGTPPPPKTPAESSAAAQAADIDRGQPVLDVASRIGRGIGDRVGMTIGIVVGIGIGAEVGSIVGGPIGEYIGKLVGSGVNHAFGP